MISKWILPLLIYKGKSGDLMSTWVDEVTTDSKAHFTVSSNRWSNNAIRLVWLQKVFERYTKPIRVTQKRSSMGTQVTLIWHSSIGLINMV